MTVSEAESESVITIDDLLRNHSISLHGEEQTDIIVIEHQVRVLSCAPRNLLQSRINVLANSSISYALAW